MPSKPERKIPVARRPQTPVMPTGELRIPIQDVISKASINPKNPDIYANYAQFMMTPNELLIDLFYVTPVSALEAQIKAEFVQRIVIPHALAKGFVTAMANTVSTFEENSHLTVPNTRDTVEGEKIVIWP